MAREYYIIGSGGFAKEVYFLADSVLTKEFVFRGFIDYKPESNRVVVRGREEQVIDEDEFLDRYSSQRSNIDIYSGIGTPKTLEKIVKKFDGFSFPNLIHKSFVGDENSIQFGIGNIVTAGCIFTVDIKIGNFNIFNLHTTVGHDCVIGNFNIFNPGCNISGGVKAGSGNLLGTNATVLQNVSIGNRSVVGAGSLANKNIADDMVMVGIPAKAIVKPGA